MSTLGYDEQRKISDIDASIDYLSTQNRANNRIIEQLAQAHADRKQNVELRDDLVRHQNEIKRLQNIIADLNDDATKALKLRVEFEKEISKLRAELASVPRVDDLVKLRDDIIAMDAKKEEKTENFSYLNEYKTVQAAYKALFKNHELLKNQFAEQKVSIQSYQRTVDDLHRQLKEARNFKEAHSDYAENLSLRSQLADKKLVISNLYENLTEANRQLKEAKEAKFTPDQDHQKVIQERNALQSKIIGMQKIIDENESNQRIMFANWTNERQKLNAEIAFLSESRVDCTTCEERQKDIDRLEEKAEELSNRIAAIQKAMGE